MSTEDNKQAGKAAPVRSGTGAGSRTTKPESWDDFFALYATTDVPEDFMTEADRNQGTYDQALRVEIEQK